MTNDTTNNAHTAYLNRASDIACLIEMLQAQLEKHARAHKAQEKRWDMVGDLGHARHELINLVSFLSETTPDEIEATLPG